MIGAGHTVPLELVASAALAPSSHNTQPWRFRLLDDAIDLFADRTRALPVNDPDDRELTISCGAALFNLRVAAAHMGLTGAVDLWPGVEADCVARVRLQQLAGPAPSAAAHPAAGAATLHPFIIGRRTYRKRFFDRAVPEDIVRQLSEAAEAEGARLVPVAGDDRRRAVAELVSEGDAAQWANPEWRRELAAWMRPPRHGDGLSMPGVPMRVARVVIRTFDMGGGRGAADRTLAEGSPLLALLETPHDTPHDWVAAGQALQRVLLTACGAGLQASYLNQPIQVAALRTRLRNTIEARGTPQLLLRLGYPRETLPPAPRRPLHDLVDAGRT